MKKSAGLFSLLTMVSLSIAWGQEAFKATQTPVAATSVPTARDVVSIDSSYVFEGSLHSDDLRGSFGKQDALQNAFEYSHRFPLRDQLFLRLGVAYERFDFSSTPAPVPNHLQSLAGVISLEYDVGNDVAAFIQIRPGIYTENEFRGEAFDCPITLGRIWVLQEDRLFFFGGVNVAFLRGEFPIFPIAGLIWKPNSIWNVFAIVPEPRVTYSPNKNLTFWAGGQLLGSSYRTDRNDGIDPHKLSNAQVDYSDYRVALGVEFHPSSQVSVSLAGGYSVWRRIDFDRAGVEFDADPAPYVRLALHTDF
jgi:hypothetical protein